MYIEKHDGASSPKMNGLRSRMAAHIQTAAAGSTTHGDEYKLPLRQTFFVCL